MFSGCASAKTITGMSLSIARLVAVDNDIPVIVFALAQPENIARVLRGEKLGTLVTK